MATPKYETPTKDVLIDLHYVQKKSRVDIEKLFNVTGPVVKRWFREHSIEFQGRRDRNRPDASVLIDLNHKQGKTIQEISQLYNTAQRYVDQWFKFYNITPIRHRKKRKLKVTREQLLSMHHHNQMSLKDISERLGVSDVIIGKWFDQYKIEKKLFSSSSPSSKAEIQLTEFVASCGFAPIKTRSVLPNRFELDVYVPEKKFAIEHCGLYWHNESRLPMVYHVVKHQYALNEGIFLLTLFEDEWIEKRPIVESMILNKLGKSKTIGARKCDIRVVESSVAKQFFNTCHIQGAPNKINIAFGLFLGEELVSCMSFGDHPRRLKASELVLQRLATKLNTVVVGGPSKLFDYALKHEKLKNRNLITWSDNRYASGEVYQHLGFTKEKVLSCDYYYVKGQRRFPKQRFQKRFVGCPPDKTEHTFALENGYSRIWDCGKIRWSRICTKAD